MNTTFGIIFDMDGTMVDNMMVHHRAWQKTLHDEGIVLTLDEVKQTIHGKNEEILQRLWGNQLTPSDVQRIAAQKEAAYRTIFKSQLQLIDGLPALLHTLMAHHISMGIGTAAPPENVQFVLDELRLHNFFQSVVHAGHVQKGKPDPEVFLKVAEELGLPPQRIIVFEDSPTGARTAHNAGMASIIITTTHPPQDFDGIPSIRSFIQNYNHITIETLMSFLNV